MFKMSPKFWRSAEFQARQLAFDFGHIARAVVTAIRPTVLEARKWAARLFPRAPRPDHPTPAQMLLRFTTATPDPI